MKKQLSIKNKRIILGTTGVVMAAGATFGITVLVTSKDIQKTSLNANAANVWTVVTQTGQAPTLPTPLDAPGDLKEAFDTEYNGGSGLPLSTFLSDKVAAPVGGVADTNFNGYLDIVRNRVQPHAKFEKYMWQVDGGAKFIGLREKPRLLFNGLGTQVPLFNANDYGTPGYISGSLTEKLNPATDMHFFYHIEGEKNVHPFASEASFIDLNLEDWFKNNPNKTPEITIYTSFFNAQQPKLNYPTFKSVIPGSNTKSLNLTYQSPDNNNYKFMLGVNNIDINGIIPGQNFADAFEDGSVSTMYQKYNRLYAWANTITSFSNFKNTDIPVITFNPKSTTQKISIIEASDIATRNLKYIYSLDKGKTWVSKADIMKMSDDEIFGHNHENISWRVEATEGHAIDPNSPEVLGQKVWLFEGQAVPEPWDTPKIVKSVYGDVAFPFPDFAKPEDFPKPTLSITDSLNYDIDVTNAFGVDFTFSFDDPNKTWGSSVGSKKIITLAEFKQLAATKQLPNLYDFSANKWIKIISTATAKNPNSVAKSAITNLEAPVGSKAIIQTKDLNIPSYLSQISAVNSRNFVITEHVPATFEMSYSLDNGLNWISKAELEKLNLFDISKAPWYHKFILQKISIKDSNTYFEDSNLPLAYDPQSNDEKQLSGLTKHESTNKEIIRKFEMPVTKLQLSDANLPTLGVGSTTGSWTISQVFPTFDSLTGQTQISPLPIIEYTFENNWNDSTKIFDSNIPAQMNLLKSQNLYDFSTGKNKTLHWRLKPSQNVPFSFLKFGNGAGLWNPKDWGLVVADKSFAAFQYEQEGTIDLGNIQVTIPKTGLVSGDVYSFLRPSITGTSSNYTITVPTVSGFTYKFKTESESSYVDEATFKTNHSDLFDTTTGKLLKVQWEITSTDPVKISDNGSLSNTASDMELALANMAVVPHIASAGTSDAWAFVVDANHSDFTYEFTFDNDFSNIDHIFKQSSSDVRKGILQTDAYLNKAGQKLSDQNLYDFVNGHFAILHWRVTNPTASMGVSTGVVERPNTINAQISVDALKALFPLIDPKTGLPTGKTRITPSISGYANSYELHDGDVFSVTSSNQIPLPGLDLEYRLEGSTAWYALSQFTSLPSHKELTDFTDPLNPKIKNVYWRVVPTAPSAGGSPITITGQKMTNGNEEGWLVDGLSTLTPTHRIVLTDIETNLGKILPVNNRDVTIGLKANQDNKNNIQLYVATNADLDATSHDFHWVTVEQALANWQTFFSERGSVKPTQLYWKAALKDSLKVNGVVKGLQLPAPTTQGLLGDSWGSVSLSNLRIIIDEAPTAPTISTKQTSSTTDKNDWSIEIVTGSHYDFEFQWDDETDKTSWLSKTDFLDKFGSDLWDKAIAGHKVLWQAVIKTGYIQDPNKPVTSKGEITPTTGAREITTIEAPKIVWLDVSSRDATHHYTDSYNLTSTSPETDMTFEYSITGSGNWMSLDNFKKTYTNLYEQSGDLSTGRLLDIYWRATAATGTYFEKSLIDSHANKGKVVIDLNPITGPSILKVVSLDTPLWNDRDTAYSYSLMSGTAQGVASFRYQLTDDPNDSNKLSADQFRSQNPTLVYEDNTDPQNVVMKIRKIYWTALPTAGYFLTNYSAGTPPIELVVVSSTSPDPIVDANGVVTFPVGWKHDINNDVWNSPDGHVFWTNPTGDIGKYQEVKSPTKINNTVYFPKDWTYDKTNDKYSSPDGKEVWVKDPATQVYVPQSLLKNDSKTSGLPIWAIAVIAAGGALLLGVGGYLIYKHVKKKKMDY